MHQSDFMRSNFRLHHKVALVFISLFLASIILTVSVNIRLFEQSVIAQKREELTFQSKQFAAVLDDLSKQSAQFMTTFAAESHLEAALVPMVENSAFYSRTGQSNTPLNKFKKAIIFQHQYSFLQAMTYAAQKEGFSRLELWLVSPHQMFADFPPAPLVQIHNGQATLNFFDQVGLPQHTSFTAPLEQLRLLDEETFLARAKRLKFAGFDEQEALDILHSSGLTEQSVTERATLMLSPFQAEQFSDKQYQDNGITLHFEQVLAGEIYNPATAANAPSPLAILVMERRVDTAWLQTMQAKLGSDFAFFQEDSLLFSTSGIPAEPTFRDQDGWLKIGRDAYLSVLLPDVYCTREQQAIYPAVVENADFISATIRRIVQVMTLIAGLIFLVIIVLSRTMVTRLVANPIGKLVLAAEQMSSGNFEMSPLPRSHDEIGFLSHTFINMSHQLKTSFDSIRTQNIELIRIRENLKTLNEELEQRVKDRTAEIARQKYILDTFMSNVPDSIYFKDRDSRFLHVNNAIVCALGCNAPTEFVGKNDFDFFPEDVARRAFEDEQQILRTGQPILAKEEANANGSWVLSTKMPLRDEHGDIIGTFGISRDITPLKHAQQQVEEAYREIQQLNEQLKQENLRMSAELDVARRLQQMVLPCAKELENISGMEIVGYMQPADEVGGDYYDVLASQNGGVCVSIGDVTGHGLESGVLMLMTQTAIRTLIELEITDSAIFLNTLNRVLYQNIQRMNVDRSLTLLTVNYQAGQLRCSGQHEELLIVRHNGQIERLDTMELGFPVGMVEDIHQWVGESTLTLRTGDGIVLYTDGITEAQNAQKRFYGLERLCAVIQQHWSHSTAEMVKNAIIEDIHLFIEHGPIHDDMTLVVMKQQ